MPARIFNQRTGVLVGTFDSYVEAAEYRRDVLRPRLEPDEPCMFAIRTAQ